MCCIKNQLTGEIYRTHAKDIRKPPVDWNIPVDADANKRRTVMLVDFSDGSSVSHSVWDIFIGNVQVFFLIISVPALVPWCTV